MRSRQARVLLALVVAFSVAACGQRLSREEIVAAATGGATGSGEFGTGTGTGGATGTGTGGATGTGTGTGGATASTVAGAIASGGTTGGGGVVDPATRAPVTAPGGDQPTTGGDVTAGGTSCPNGPLAPVNIGHLGGYEGLVGTALAGGLEMAQVWARSVNSRGGLNCHPVNLIALNDRNDPNTNATLVRRLVEQEGVIAFVGNLTPLSLGGGLAYLEQRGVPVVGDDLVHPASFTSPIVFTQGAAVDVAGPGSMAAGVAAAQARGLPNPTRVALFVCEVEACTSAASKITGAGGRFGYELVYSPGISLTQTNFTSQCNEARRLNVGVVFIAGAGATLEAAANSCADQGYRPQYVTYSLAIQNSLAGNPNLEGVVGASPTFPWMLTDGAAAEYAGALQQFNPGLVTSGASSAVWTAGKLLEAASRNLSANPTSEEILAGLDALEGDNLGGLAPPLSFNLGQPNAHLACYFIVQVSGGQWTAPRGSECVTP